MKQTDAWTAQETFDATRIVLAVVGGIAGVVALTVVYRRQRLGEAADYREDTKLNVDRFAKAAELLGSDQAAARLAGVYAVGALADDWTEGRQTCIDVLCAYLRMPYAPPRADTKLSSDTAIRRPVTMLGRLRSSLHRATSASLQNGPGGTDDDRRDVHEERQVRHTIIRLIRDHLRPGAATSWHGHDLDFTGAVLDGGDFEGAKFSGGRVSFTRAKFISGDFRFDRTELDSALISFDYAEFLGANVSFTNAQFIVGGANFSGANFAAGSVSFTGTNFAGAMVIFNIANFTGVVSFSHAKFAGGVVTFDSAEISGGRLSFDSATFTGGQVQFGFVEFAAGRVSFTRAAFIGSEVSFVGARFTGAAVVLADVEEWTVPAVFDSWSDGPPPGLVLPPTTTDAPAGAHENT